MLPNEVSVTLPLNKSQARTLNRYGKQNKAYDLNHAAKLMAEPAFHEKLDAFAEESKQDWLNKKVGKETKKAK